MRTLSRQLLMPQIVDVVPDETAYAIYLPRRGTRILYRLLALLAGAAAGLAYARFTLHNPGVLWTVAITLIGAILGFVLMLMPGVLVRHTRRLWTRLALGRHTRAYLRGLDRTLQDLERRVTERPDDAAAWNALGVIAILQGEYERALTALERACATDAVPHCKVNLAAAQAEVGDFAGAVDTLLQATGAAETADAAQHNIGVLLRMEPPMAVVESLRAQVNHLASAVTLNALGSFELAAGDLERAEQYFRRAVNADPAAVSPRANLGLLQYRRGRTAEAIRLLHEAAQLEPFNAALVNNLGALLCAGGRPLIAIRQLSRAALLAPGSPAVELNRGAVHLALGHYPESLESFTAPEVRAAWPVIAAHDAGLALIGLGRLEAAAEVLEEGLAHDEDDFGLRNNLGCVAWAQGDDARMVEELTRASSIDESEPGALLNLATARIALGDPAGAMELIERIPKTRRSAPEVRFIEGLAYLEDALHLYAPNMSRRQREAFFQALHRCVRPLSDASASDGGGSAEALVNLAIYHYLRLEFEEAAEGFLQVAQMYPDNGFLQFCAGTALAEAARVIQQAHQAEGDELVGQARELLRRARACLEKAVALEEINADVFCNLGMVLYNLGEDEPARAAFRRMVQLEESADAANNLAIAHAREAQQLQHAARATALVSSEREREMLQKAQTHISTALHYFMKALEHQRDDPCLHGNIGLAFMIRNRKGDIEAALRHWQRMQQLGGAAVRARYEELTALAHGEEGTKARFDESIMAFRSLDARAGLMVMPPRLVGPRYALQMVSEEIDWLLLSDEPAVRQALRRRDRLAGLRKRLARLSL